jgi:NADP-dependent 3-hydroxy acid dehydrogenase YdfG
MNVVITGATGGIGVAVAKALRARGANLALVARRRGRLEENARQLGGTPFAADLTDAAQVGALGASLTRLFGDVPDVVINAAGAFDLAPIASTSVATFDAMLNTNLRAPFLLTQALLPRMLERKAGHIVSIGSIAGRQAFPGNGAYSASKFGLRGLHEVLQQELKGSGVRATLIEPAATDTALWEAVDYEQNPGLPAAEAMLAADDVARCVVFAVEQPATVNIKYMGVERS